MRNPVKALVKRWAREEAVTEIDEQTQAKQDACGHWVSGTWRENILYCDACDKNLTTNDAEAGQSQGDAPGAIEQRYVERVF